MTPHPVTSVPRLDWRAYFQEFMEVHGGNPIEHKGWFLFQDGFRYSRTNHAGPEVAPVNEEERTHLSTVYWGLRKKIIRGQLHALTREIAYISEEQSIRSAPLQQMSYTIVEGKVENLSGSVDIEEMKLRLSWLEEDLAYCDKMLLDLKPRSEVEDGSSASNVG